MKLTKLEIRRTDTYDTPPNTLQGVVTLTGDGGTQSIVLSPTTLVEIFKVIEKDAAQRARLNAAEVGSTLVNAGAEILLADDTRRISG